MTNSTLYPRLLFTACVAGLMSGLAAHPLSAQGVGGIVRGLNAVINPGDAQRLEDQARRNNQPAEERYWRDYRTGLETPDRSHATGARRDYGDRRFDPSDPRTFRSDAAINLELGQLSRDEQRRYREMTDRERRQYDDRLAQDAQRRYERMTDPERQRYIDDLQSEQRRPRIARAADSRLVACGDAVLAGTAPHLCCE
jgi:hypothetical protein